MQLTKQITKELLDFDMPTEPFPVGPILEDRFDISNLSSQRIRFKIDRITSSDFQLVFSTYSGMLEPVFYFIYLFSLYVEILQEVFG